jgi:lipoprotein-anchoring transpeptidase ErfK/SrfK
MNQLTPIVDGPLTIHIDVKKQVLELRRHGNVEKTYPVSTSRFGLGSEPGSYKTPVGRFFVSDKIGADAPLRTVFKSRLPVGEFLDEGGEDDLVLTRILWLSGLEPHNANTRDRYIYIHGTNHELLLGTPSSHGCVRMRNQDVAEFFEMVPEGTPLEIVA